MNACPPSLCAQKLCFYGAKLLDKTLFGKLYDKTRCEYGFGDEGQPKLGWLAVTTLAGSALWPGR